MSRGKRNGEQASLPSTHPALTTKQVDARGSQPWCTFAGLGRRGCEDRDVAGAAKILFLPRHLLPDADEGRWVSSAPETFFLLNGL